MLLKDDRLYTGAPSSRSRPYVFIKGTSSDWNTLLAGVEIVTRE